MSVVSGSRPRRLLQALARRLATGLGLAGLLGGASAQALDAPPAALAPPANTAPNAERARLEARVALVRQAAAARRPVDSAVNGINPDLADGAPPVGPADDDSVAWNNWPKWGNWANWANG